MKAKIRKKIFNRFATIVCLAMIISLAFGERLFVKAAPSNQYTVVAEESRYILDYSEYSWSKPKLLVVNISPMLSGTEKDESLLDYDYDNKKGYDWDYNIGDLNVMGFCCSCGWLENDNRNNVTKLILKVYPYYNSCFEDKLLGDDVLKLWITKDDSEEKLVEIDVPISITDKNDTISKIKEREENKDAERVYVYTQEQYDYWMQFSNDRYYNTLDENKKEVWRMLERECVDFIYNGYYGNYVGTDMSYMEGCLSVQGLNSDEAFELLLDFIWEHPQFYFLNTMTSVVWDEGDSVQFGLGIYEEFADPEVRRTSTIDFCETIDTWMKQITAEKRSVDKEKKAHDLICEHANYSFTIHDQSSYGIVCDKCAVCAGYAKTMHMLMNGCGIETLTVQSEEHAWNVINLHGVWYNVDVTFDDGTYYDYYNPTEKHYCNYYCFNVSSKTVKTSDEDAHTLLEGFETSTPKTEVDSVSDGESPYFTSGNYVYFIANDNKNCGELLCVAIEALNGSSINDTPDTVTYNSEVYRVVAASETVNVKPYVGAPEMPEIPETKPYEHQDNSNDTDNGSASDDTDNGSTSNDTDNGSISDDKNSDNTNNDDSFAPTGQYCQHYQGYDFYKDDSGDMRCYDSTGKPVINEFKCDGTYTYYFQADGTAMKDRLTYHPDGVHVIYFDSEGHEVFSDFANVRKTIAGDEVNDFCFFDVFGYMYVDVLTYDKTGSVLYYANPYGVMEMGKWFQFSDTVMWADGTPAEGIAGGYGYANEDGTLMTNTATYDWEGRSCYLQGNGVALY